MHLATKLLFGVDGRPYACRVRNALLLVLDVLYPFGHVLKGNKRELLHLFLDLLEHTIARQSVHERVTL